MGHYFCLYISIVSAEGVRAVSVLFAYIPGLVLNGRANDSAEAIKPAHLSGTSSGAAVLPHIPL